MKRTIFAALAVAMMMVGCSQKQQVPQEKQYVINVTTNWCNDGDTIYLVSEDTIGIETVKDNKVTFIGKYEQVFGAYLDYSNSDPRTDVDPLELFIVEDTITNVSVQQGQIMYDNPLVEGGQAQGLLNEINKNVWEKVDQMNALLDKAYAAEACQADSVAIMQQIDSIGTAVLNQYADFIIANMPSNFSDVAFVLCGGIAHRMENLTGNKNEDIKNRLFDAFAKKQPDAHFYTLMKEENK